jgi:hypothetical protein
VAKFIEFNYLFIYSFCLSFIAITFQSINLHLFSFYLIYITPRTRSFFRDRFMPTTATQAMPYGGQQVGTAIYRAICEHEQHL